MKHETILELRVVLPRQDNHDSSQVELLGPLRDHEPGEVLMPATNFGADDEAMTLKVTESLG